MNQRYFLPARRLGAIAIAIAAMMAAGAPARADESVVLMKRVAAALHANDRLNGAKAYTAAPGVIVLYGTVFDDKDRKLAEQVAGNVRGVNQVVDNLRTRTGKWFQDEERINTQLQMNGLNDVQVHVVGPTMYLSGQVASQADKDRAASIAQSVYPRKHVESVIWVQPQSLF